MSHSHELLKLVALRKADEAMVLLDDKGIKKHLNEVDVHGNSALNYACAMGLPEELVLKMLELGADPKSKNNMGAGTADITRMVEPLD
jgi:ankyrin repeat protein